MNEIERMEHMEELISKKELLAMTKISYGQLYRWKRMNIIPEDWFIKKSMPTGQETFFRRDKILERIKLILSLKDDVQLEDIAELLNKKDKPRTFTIDELMEKNIISEAAKTIFYSLYELDIEITKREILILRVIEKNVVSSVMTMDEFKVMLPIIQEHYETLLQEEAKVYLYRKMGVPFVVACTDSNQLVIEEQAKLIVTVELFKEDNELALLLL